MKKIIVCFICLSVSCLMYAQQPYHMQSVPLQTRWAPLVSPSNALPEYPRPQMVRGGWQNLNGLWDYTITMKGADRPVAFDGTILVPYPLESALSGVRKALQPDQLLWYRRLFRRPLLHKGKRVLLHFGAVDYEATVYVNGVQAGTHSGGYTEFAFDVTKLLKAGDNEVVVKVYDPSDQGVGPHGKQVLDPQNIYYTSSSGIWQTVWLETVAAAYVGGLELTPDIDKGILHVRVEAPVGYTVVVTAHAGDIMVSEEKGESGKLAGVEGSALTGGEAGSDLRTGVDLSLPVKDARLWSPDHPFLYDLDVKLIRGGKTVDAVRSYFGMRKIAIAKDTAGVDRIFLNNQPYYNLGTLDQGFWPDGLYTAPTDEALSFDIRAIKAMGFNTIRKHIKVEPARWYYWADKLGMLVWQDMVNPNQRLPEGSKAAFEKQCAETLAQLQAHPCITAWVLFNEKWGQYDQQRLTAWIKKTDPSRIVNGHTGELLYVNEQLRSPSPNAYVDADMTDVHSYPDPMMPIRQAGKAQVCGEFGGIGVFIPDHQWLTGSAWGYIQEKPAGLMAKYKIMAQHLLLLEREGLSGSIYTQPFDVEGEQNGLMTYDRAVVKIPFGMLRQIHALLNPDMGDMPVVEAADADLTEPGWKYSALLQEYIDGKRDAAFLKKLAMTAMQVGDKPGATLAGTDYVRTLQLPLSNEDMTLVAQFTKSTKDPGAALMKGDAAAFKKVIGDRQYTVDMMNMIYHGEMEPMMSDGGEADWDVMEKRVKPYGDAGEEIFLRAKTIAFYNKQDWAHYVPVAEAYLGKYGASISEQERTMFRQAMEQHPGLHRQP